MKATALKAFRHDQLGLIEKGEFTASAEHVPTLRGLAFVELHETKPHKAAATETKPEPVAPETKAATTEAVKPPAKKAAKKAAKR